MTQDHKTKVLAQLEPFWQLDIDKRIAETYKDYTDFSSIKIGNYYSVEEVSLYSKKMISQFGQVLETAFANILPYQYQFQNDFGNGNLGDDLSSFNSYLGQNDFVSAVNILTRLVYYQVANNFWDKVLEKDDKARFTRVAEMQEKLDLHAKTLERYLSLTSDMHSNLKNSVENIDQLIKIKEKELAEIERLLPTARNNSDEISRLLNTSTATNESINSLLSQQNKNLDETGKKLEDEKKIFQAFQEEIEALKTRFNSEIKESGTKNESFETLLQSVTERSSTFDKRIGVLNELIGKEGAEKLFNTFNDRKNALNDPIRRWANIVFGTGVAALILIIGIFTNFFGLVGGYPTNVDWHYLLINSIKSLPIMIVLLFTIRQYVKERTFQEEYAFRSAIALTVQAYGDIAGSKKEELIMKAISTIYSLPSMMKERRNSGFFGMRSKLLNETLDELRETLKAIKE